MTEVAERAGWRVTGTRLLDTCALQDGDWEIALALEDTLPGVLDGSIPLGSGVRSLAAGIGDALAGMANLSGRRPLPAYAMTASRD